MLPKFNRLIKDFIYNYKEKDKSFITELALQPYSEKYLHSNFKDGHPDGGRIEYVNLFSIIAVFILLIACINFMNLATARSCKACKRSWHEKSYWRIAFFINCTVCWRSFIAHFSFYYNCNNYYFLSSSGIQSINGKTTAFTFYTAAVLDNNSRACY